MKHYNPSINKSMSDIFNLKGESTNEVNDILIPCIIVNPKIDIVRVQTATNSALVTIYTTPTDKDFYLTNVNISLIKDVLAVATYAAVQIKVDGVDRQIIKLQGITLTPQISQLSNSYNIPVKIDRNTPIYIVTDHAGANIAVSASIVGYLVETVKNT